MTTTPAHLHQVIAEPEHDYVLGTQVLGRKHHPTSDVEVFESKGMLGVEFSVEVIAEVVDEVDAVGQRVGVFLHIVRSSDVLYSAV
jgi:hypothetical protein